MPLPVRAASVRTSATDNRRVIPRPAQKSQIGRSAPPQDVAAKAINTASQVDDLASTASSAKDSHNGTQSVSSRIPSPTKSIVGNGTQLKSQSQHATITGAQARPSLQPKLPVKGHTRQRSAILPPSIGRQSFGHSRSISAVSVNTTPTSSNDAPRLATRSRLNQLQPPSSPTKSKVLPTPHASTQSTPRSSTSSTTTTAPDALQNEILQLSIVHNASSQSMRALESSIARSFATKQAKLQTIQADVDARKQAFSDASNLYAIDSWLQEQGYQKACQSMQNLSVAVRDIQHLEQIFAGEDGLAAGFQEWQAQMSDGDSRGEMSGTPDITSVHLVFEEQIAPALKRFKQQVGSALAVLEGLPEVQSDSSLHAIVKSHIALADSLSSQCKVMLQIGEQLVAEHLLWLEDEVANAVRDLRSNGGVEHYADQPDSTSMISVLEQATDSNLVI